MKKSEIIGKYLQAKTHKDLASLYSLEMECQVNVAQDNGERIDGEFKGKLWHGWTDGIETWKPFRIPYKANSEPEYTDTDLKFNFEKHVEAIGMTGWNWKQKISKWVAFDFDSIFGHKGGLSNDEIKNIQDSVANIEWVTIRKSTSGKGIHLYIFLNNIPCVNHTEHSALARSILGKLSALTGCDFKSKVDTCGGNMWVWHRKMDGTDGLELIKQGTVLESIPQNWRDHISVVTGARKRTLPQFIKDVDPFEELTGQRPKVNLDDEHKRLIEYLKDNKCFWWWDQDHHMLVTHTVHLRDAFTALNFKGIFKTISEGKEIGHDHNCYAFPLRRGGWVIRRYTPGVQESETWDQDAAGWTRCYYNKEPDFRTSCKTYGGVESPKGGFIFREAENAVKAAILLGANLEIPPWANARSAKLLQHKDGRLIFEFEHKPNDVGIEGWLPEKGLLKKIYNINVGNTSEPDVGNFDDTLRHIVTETNEDYGWAIRTSGSWNNEPLAHIRVALKGLGFTKEVDLILGSSVLKCWKLVNRPFEPEYPGDRCWNRNSAQLRFIPSQNIDHLSYPTWNKVLNHIGSSLDASVETNGWCKANGINTGSEYLKLWIASLFQAPLEPLPYLFLYGPQNSGKSILHEALSLLITKGYARADNALINQQGFNGELEGAIICVVEEINLQKSTQAYNRIKDWVTGKYLPVHPKMGTPYTIPNTTHWIQCANDPSACPVFAGDTRITMIYVDNLSPENLIPKRALLPLLEKEASDFLAEMLNLELPKSNDRLNVPILVTEDKLTAEELNLTMLELFIKENVHYVPGKKIKFSVFVAKFYEFLEPNDMYLWSKIRIGKELPQQFPKGRDMADGAQFYIGNISWDAPDPALPVLPKLIKLGEKLVVNND